MNESTTGSARPEVSMRPARVFRAALLLSALAFPALEPRALGQNITEFPVPTAGGLLGIAAGPDGALWFTESSKIGRITTDGAVTEYTIPAGSHASHIAAGPDGTLWFTEGVSGKIGRITTGGLVTGEFIVPTGYPIDIARGADASLWFTELDGSKIGRITTAGVIAEFPSTGAGGSAPPGIAAGPDGALWFTEPNFNKIGRISTAGLITGEFTIPTAGSYPIGIAAGADGALWFAEQLGNKIGRITTAGVITEFAIPTIGVQAFSIAAGPDGNLWFTELAGGKIGRITTAGVITEFATTTGSTIGIAAGPDSAVWFTEPTKIGRIATPASRVLPVVGSTPGANGTFFKTSVQLHNPGSAQIAGQIVFHASGTSGSNSDPALPYSLAPGQTQSIPDLLPAMGRSGLGSVDIEVTSGSSPVATARVFNDAGAAGTTGFTEEVIRPEDALPAGARGVLLLPSDLTAFRFNIGVRTLELGASITLTVRDSAGVVVASVPRVFPAIYHLQQSAAEFLTGSSPPPGGSVTVQVVSGSAIVYGATVDNLTGDPSLQVARASP